MYEKRSTMHPGCVDWRGRIAGGTSNIPRKEGQPAMPSSLRGKQSMEKRLIATIVKNVLRADQSPRSEMCDEHYYDIFLRATAKTISFC